MDPPSLTNAFASESSPANPEPGTAPRPAMPGVAPIDPARAPGERVAPWVTAAAPPGPPAPPAPAPAPAPPADGAEQAEITAFEPVSSAPPVANPLENAFSDIFSAGAADLTAPAWPPSPDSGLPAWPPPPGSTPPKGNGASPDQLDTTVEQLLPAFKQIARARLQRSALRVETMLDDAAQQGRPVEAVLAEIRGLTIRGVMQSTLDQVVDEMMAVALEHHQ